MKTLNELQHGDIVTLRRGRHGRTSVDWEGWKEAKLWIARHPKSGKIMTLTIDGDNWAEYNERDYHGNGFFDCEEYCLEIQGLN